MMYGQRIQKMKEISRSCIAFSRIVGPGRVGVENQVILASGPRAWVARTGVLGETLDGGMDGWGDEDLILSV